MKVYFHDDFYHVYTSDPAASAGRMEAVVEAIQHQVDFIKPEPASKEDLMAVHSESHIKAVQQQGLYEIASLAAGAALRAALTGLAEPCFALVRPPGHHASSDGAWGFCYFNNMAVALTHLQFTNRINTAYVLDFDLHYGDGNVNILGNNPGVTLLNPETLSRKDYLVEVQQSLEACRADIIGVSAGFDHHIQDWGGLLTTEDYHVMGRWVNEAAQRSSGGCFGILEGGYNHDVLGQNVSAFIEGLCG